MVSLRRIVADFKIFGKGYIRSRIGLFFTLVFPIILILLFGEIFSGGSSGPLNVYVQNNDSGPIGTAFVHALNGTSALRLIPVPTNQNFSQYLSLHSASNGIVIPLGFTGAYLANQKVNVTLYGNPALT